MRQPRTYSPMIFAVVALAFSVGVGTFATASHLRVTRSDLADNAVTGPKVARNAITGKDIRERSLATVPNAGAVRGVSIKKFRRRTQPAGGDPFSTVVRLGGLTLRSQCILQQPDIAFPRVTARTTVDHAILMIAPTKGLFGSNGQSYHEGNTDFRPGETMMVMDTESQAVIRFTYSTPGGRTVDGVLSLAYAGPTCKIDGVVRGG